MLSWRGPRKSSAWVETASTAPRVHTSKVAEEYFSTYARRQRKTLEFYLDTSGTSSQDTRHLTAQILQVWTLWGVTFIPVAETSLLQFVVEYTRASFVTMNRHVFLWSAFGNFIKKFYVWDTQYPADAKTCSLNSPTPWFCNWNASGACLVLYQWAKVTRKPGWHLNSFEALFMITN